MQQRRLRLGDILDDYCPRERRITNHAVVAMIEDQVKQTRCTTCDADHEYKQARVPARRKKEPGVLVPKVSAGTSKARSATPSAVDAVDTAQEDVPSGDEFVGTPGPAHAAPEAAAVEPSEPDHADPATEQEPVAAAPANEDGPVHRRLIRATLPRPEGQPQDWKNPDFTVRQPSGGRSGGGGFEGNRNGHRPAGRGSRRTTRAQGSTPGQPTRFGGQRQGSSRQGSGQPQGQGNRSGGGRPGHAPGHGQGPGQHRGPRQGGHGRKRGR
jgi:translation initiation factor IF-2